MWHQRSVQLDKDGLFGLGGLTGIDAVEQASPRFCRRGF
jgi:hypothetical protein